MSRRQHSNVGPWRIDDSAVYERKSRDKQLSLLLRFAILEPSRQNTQPWTFSITNDGVDVYADYSRRLPVVDPVDGELLMSVGAAIMNFRVAAARFGFDVSVSYTPGREGRVPVAHISVCQTYAPDEELIALFPAILRQHTNRGWTWLRQRSPSAALEDEPIDPTALSTVCDVLDRFPETLRLVSPHQKRRAAPLIDFASRSQRSRPMSSEELPAWIRPGGNDGPSEEGGRPASLITGPWPLPLFGAGAVPAPLARQGIESEPALIVVTSEDDRGSLIQAGEVLERLLLVITAARLQYSFFNHPIELEDLRDRVPMLAAYPLQPQVLLRVSGARASAPLTRRRRLEDVGTR